MASVQIDIEQALSTLGELLESRGVACEIVVVGGGALQLLGLITRPTKDLDVVALVRDGRLEGADPFPPDLARARDDVANALGLPRDWLNPGPSDLLTHGLPEGFDDAEHEARGGGVAGSACDERALDGHWQFQRCVRGARMRAQIHESPGISPRAFLRGGRDLNGEGAVSQ